MTSTQTSRWRGLWSVPGSERILRQFFVFVNPVSDLSNKSVSNYVVFYFRIKKGSIPCLQDVSANSLLETPLSNWGCISSSNIQRGPIKGVF